MKFIHIGLTTKNLNSLLHDFVEVSSQGPLLITGLKLDNQNLPVKPNNKSIFSFCTEKLVRVESKSSAISISDGTAIVENLPCQNVSLLVVKPQGAQNTIIVSTRDHKETYSGELMIIAQDNKIRLILNCLLEEYVVSVIKTEMPASYHLEAIKAQAVCARTYALHPRVNHQNDLCNVCDSYLCCQAFSGWRSVENSVHKRASAETVGQILTYKNEPILALFSACAGGHTENYEDCFSDWATGEFPPQPLPYLRGVSESTLIGSTNQLINETALKKLWQDKNLSTDDAWSKQFHWSIHLSIDDLESKMHHTLSKLMTNKDFAPFILAPPSKMFGDIQSFSIDKRGIGGTAIILTVHTSKGIWQLVKELTIRSLFKNQNINLARLPSAKIFFNHTQDDKQQLQSLMIYGLGHGHGVGLQQVGAEGLARLKIGYRQILKHYYADTSIDTA